MRPRRLSAVVAVLLAGLPFVLGGTCRTQVDQEPRVLYTEDPTPPPPVTPLPANFLQPAVYHDLLDADQIVVEGDKLLQGNQLEEALAKYHQAINLYRLVEIHHPEGAKVACFKRRRLEQRSQQLVEEQNRAAYNQFQGQVY